MSDETTTQPAGWYLDPAGSGGQRWWDGARWGAVAAGPSAAAEAKARPASVKAAFVAAAGAALAALGCFLPWISVSAPLVGTVTRNGVDGFGDGWIVLALAVIGGAVAAIHVANPQSARVGVVPAIMGALMGLVVAYDGMKVLERVSDVEGSGVSASIGVGIFAMGAGAGAMLVGGIAMWRMPTR